MSLYGSKTYLDDLGIAFDHTVDAGALAGKTVLVAGARGLIGSFLVDILGWANQHHALGVNIIATGRSLPGLERRFDGYPFPGLQLAQLDVENRIELDTHIDAIVHAASNAHPATMNADPIGTVMANVEGVRNLAEWGLEHKCKRMLYVSSGEVYGQGDTSLDAFPESYQGYVDPLSMRSCYPLSKRTAENLCIAYGAQKDLDCVIVRPCHTYGPNATSADSRANAQFVADAIAGRNIVMNSTGSQIRSYSYIADTVSGLLSVLNCGKKGHAYNLANPGVCVSIAEFAREVARQADVEVSLVEASAEVRVNETPIIKQVLATKQLEELDWRPCYTLSRGIEHTLRVLRDAD